MHSTTKLHGADGQYTRAERETFAAIRAALAQDVQQRRKLRDTALIAAAVQLAPLLKRAREHLATFRPKVCCACGYVFSPCGSNSRSDGAAPRCLDCTPRPITDNR